MTAVVRRRVLVIAGTDPTGGAGVVADVAALEEMGADAAVAVTAVTVQDDGGVHRVVAVEPAVIVEQIRAARATGSVDAVKVGMLAQPASVAAVVEALEGWAGPVVVDPVLSASAGGALAEPGVERALVELLWPRATLVTPNLDEAAVLAGVDRSSLDDDSAMEAAAGRLAEAGTSVLVTGGHRRGDADDLLWVDGAAVWLRAARRSGPDRRGTGCRLSSAIAAGLAEGLSVEDACRQAKAALLATW